MIITRTIEKRVTELEKHIATLTSTETDNQPRGAVAWKHLILDFADDLQDPQLREELINKVQAIEPDEDILIGRMSAWVKEERALIDQHLANLELEFKDENARREAKELLETMRVQSALKEELLAVWREGPNQIKSVSGSDLEII